MDSHKLQGRGGWAQGRSRGWGWGGRTPVGRGAQRRHVRDCARSDPRRFAAVPPGVQPLLWSLAIFSATPRTGSRGPHPQRAYLAQIEELPWGLRNLRHAYLVTDGNGGRGTGAEPAVLLFLQSVASPAR